MGRLDLTALPDSAMFDRLARYYDLEHGDIQEDIPVYLEFARATEGPVLELACGTGRILLPLAQAGHDVTGIDLSAEMLRQARRKLDATPGLRHPPRLIQGDMTTFSFADATQRFGLIIIGLNSLMHVSSQSGQRQTLLRGAMHLLPGGRLIVDLFNPDTVLDDENDGHLFLHCVHFLPESGAHLMHFQSPRTNRTVQTITMQNYYDEITIDERVRRTLAPFQLRYLAHSEVELLIDAAGLTLDAIYGDYDLSPAAADSPRLLVVARRGG